MKTHLRQLAWPLLAAAAVACGPADETQDAEAGAADAPAEAPGEVTAPMMADWDVRLDSPDAERAGFQMTTEGDGFAVRTGPAGIAWRATDLAMEGSYSVSATFTERGAPADHREAYGIFVGGQNLESPDQAYTYFLIRGDGSYLIKRRTGSETSQLVGWTGSEAVQAVESQGQENPNMLRIEVGQEEVAFVVNGTTVETLQASRVQPYGFAGVRVNHSLDVRIDDWTVEGATGQTAGDEEDASEASDAGGAGG